MAHDAANKDVERLNKVHLKENTTGVYTKKLSSIICNGHREHEFTDGIFNTTECHKNIKFGDQGDASTLLNNSISLEAALSNAGADADAAMGQWWVYATDIQCDVEFGNTHKYNCKLTVEQ